MHSQDSITISDVLKMECMRNAKVIGGDKGINNVVSRVNIMADQEILNWVSPGELLFLTTYSFDVSNIEWQKEFIKECSNKKLSGIGIKMYPDVDKLSDEIIVLADELEVPIINIEHSIPYSEIMTYILKEIFNKQAAFLERMENMHNKIMNLILTEASVEEILDVVHDNVNNPVMIRLEFPDKTITNFNGINEEIKQSIINNSDKFFGHGVYSRDGEKILITKEFIKGSYIKRIIKPIVVKDNIYGYILVWAVNQNFSDFDYSVIEASVSAISMEILKNLSIKEVESRYKQEFIDDLISMDNGRINKAIERAMFFKLQEDAKYQFIVVHVSRQNIDQTYTELQMSHILSKILQLIDKKLDESQITSLASKNGDNINILFSCKETKSLKQSTDNIVKWIDKTLIDKIEQLNVSIGIGRSYNGINCIYKSYTDAFAAIETGEVLHSSRVSYFEDLGIYKLLCQKCLENELESFYSSAIEELVEYDSKKSTELIKTLEAYFECNGNLKKMAEMLYTHYNTISYRITRIEDIAGISLDNANERLNLEVALKIKRYLRK